MYWLMLGHHFELTLLLLFLVGLTIIGLRNGFY